MEAGKDDPAAKHLMGGGGGGVCVQEWRGEGGGKVRVKRLVCLCGCMCVEVCALGRLLLCGGGRLPVGPASQCN